MDPTAAGNAAAATRTVGGRLVNTSGGRGRRPKKKPSFARDAQLARDGARLMTGPFRPPGEPPVFTPAAAAAPAALPIPRHRPPLPLLTSPPAMTITAVCPGDVFTCPDGSVVSREIVNGGCNFAPCPDRAYPVGTAGGHLFPVWVGGGGTGTGPDDGGASTAIGESVHPH